MHASSWSVSVSFKLWLVVGRYKSIGTSEIRAVHYVCKVRTVEPQNLKSSPTGIIKFDDWLLISRTGTVLWLLLSVFRASFSVALLPQGSTSAADTDIIII
jgi:hypothetical protein